MPAVDSALSKRTGLLDASAYALVVAELVAIAVWTRDFFVSSSDARIFETVQSYFAFGGHPSAGLLGYCVAPPSR
jgi:hypothetical protein